MKYGCIIFRNNRKTCLNFTAFLLAISKKLMMKIKDPVRSRNLNRISYACLFDISNDVDTQWMNYYMKFGLLTRRLTDENYNNLIENNNEEKNDFWNFMRSSSYCRINIC